MRLTSESPRLRWWVMAGVWLVCAGAIALHTAVVRDYVALLNGVGAAGAIEGATPRRQVIPARYADAQMWVRHVQAAEAEGKARVRFTAVDNAPDGREVHWSSAFGWLLRGAAAWQRATSASGGPAALERVLAWVNAPLLLAAIVVFSGWAAARAGVGVGVLVALAMLGHPRFYEGFAPSYADHHGLATAALLGLVLGGLFMGAGWWRANDGGRSVLPASARQARMAATASAVCGAVGLWVNAATAVPGIALVGVAGAVMGCWRGRVAEREGATFEPNVWRWWGRVGAAGSLVCYLFEYAPNHFGWRLEANHPLYALAWWGGAELVAWLVEWRLGRAARRVAGVKAAAAALALASPLVALLVGGTAVFAVADPFVGALRHFVAEGMTSVAAMRLHGWGVVGVDLGCAAGLLALAGWTWRVGSGGAVGVGFAALVVAGFVVMGVGEMRWWMGAAAAEIALLAGIAGGWGQRRGRWLALAVMAFVCVAPAAYRIGRDGWENRRGAVAEGDLMQPLYRDIAVALRASQPEGEIVLLTNPNASAGVGYFGDFKTLGTLYWENAAGLRAAAEIFSASDDAEAERRIRARGVTHVAMISRGNFLGEYFQLLRPGGSEAEAKRGFGYRLLSEPANAPVWLQAVPWRRAPELAKVGGTVALFKVVKGQDEVERLIHVARAQAAAGERAAAERTFERVLALVPREARGQLGEGAGVALLEAGAEAEAVRMFRRALEVRFDPQVANAAAWILATTRDAALRDARGALELLEKIPPVARESAAVWSTFAAAWAELGKWSEAVRAGERAVALARAERDAEAERVLRERLEAYRRGEVPR